MLIFTKTAELQRFLNQVRDKGQSIGFVPTMGALHAGHTALVDRAKAENQLNVCSIFVNPRQFNNPQDLERYPRTPESDAELLRNAGCDVLFSPEGDELFRDERKMTFDFGHLDKSLEGASRPGHFRGVAEVVYRLFDVVQPQRAYFGKKDYQQLLIVKELARLHFPRLAVIGMPTVREADGLAMSSRNRLLSASERAVAATIPAAMAAASNVAKREGVTAAREFIGDEIARHETLRLDYYEICDARTLRPLTTLKEDAVSLIAVFCGKVRLIDNLEIT